MIKAIVVDDEPLAREELIRLIGADRDFEVVAQAENGYDALQKMKKGVVDYLVKPVTHEQLVAAVQKAIQERKWGPEEGKKFQP